jgi:hypothetical protein
VTRINIVVEGPAEESFIKNLLAPFLWPQNIYVTPFVLGVPGHKGGNVNYARVKKDVILQLKQDRTTYCSTMFDLYGLGDGFPEMPLPANLSGLEKATRIEKGIYQDIISTIPELRPDIRFFPYLQVHEYEGLLFSNPETFANALGKGTLSQQLRSIRNTVTSPEDINDDPNTAPSKRILRLYPSYKKVIEGTVAAQAIGLQNMRQECPHFSSWVANLQSIVPLV